MTISIGPPIHIGLIGTGYMSLQAYLPGFRRQGAVVSAIWGRDQARVDLLAQQHGIPRAYADYRALVADPDVQAIVVASPNHLHHEMVLEVAKAGKPVFCEKPLGVSLAEAREMVDAIERAGVFHGVPFTWRWPDHSREVKRLLAGGYLGRIYDLHLVFSVAAWATPTTSLGWRGVHALGGEGVLADFGGHLGDLTRWYAGELTRVAAHGRTHIPVRTPLGANAEQVDVLDSCNLLFETTQGTQGSFQMSYVSPAYPLLIRVELHGERGAIVYELEMRGDMLLTRLGRRENQGGPLEWESQTQPFSEIVDHLCAGFLLGVTGQPTEMTTLHDGLRGQAIIEAAKQSMNSGCWTPVSAEAAQLPTPLRPDSEPLARQPDEG